MDGGPAGAEGRSPRSDSVSLRSKASFLPRRFGPRASLRQGKGWVGSAGQSCDVPSQGLTTNCQAR